MLIFFIFFLLMQIEIGRFRRPNGTATDKKVGGRAGEKNVPVRECDRVVRCIGCNARREEKKNTSPRPSCFTREACDRDNDCRADDR